MGAPALGACVFARVISSCCTDPCGITKWSPSQPFTFFPFTLWAPPHWPLWLGLAAFPGVFVPKPALLSSFSPGGEVTQAVVRGRSSAFSTLSPDLWFPAKRALSPLPPRGITFRGLTGVWSRPGPLPGPRAPRPRHEDRPHAGTFHPPAVRLCPWHFLATQCLRLLSLALDPPLSVPLSSSLPSHLPPPPPPP